jgi:hypothetical protein
MAHQCIKYRLTAQGSVPDFICSHEESLSGMYAVDTETHQPPQELLLVGISEKDATGDFEVILTKEDLQSYLTVVGADWVTLDYASSITEEYPAKKPFNAVAATDFFWGKLDALNAL